VIEGAADTAAAAYDMELVMLSAWSMRMARLCLQVLLL